MPAEVFCNYKQFSLFLVAAISVSLNVPSDNKSSISFTLALISSQDKNKFFLRKVEEA